MKRTILAALAALTLMASFVLPAKAETCTQSCIRTANGYVCTTNCY